MITTTAGHETVECALGGSGQTAFCSGRLVGEPMLGGTATLTVDGVAAARGVIPAQQ